MHDLILKPPPSLDLPWKSLCHVGPYELQLILSIHSLYFLQRNKPELKSEAHSITPKVI